MGWITLFFDNLLGSRWYPLHRMNAADTKWLALGYHFYRWKPLFGGRCFKATLP